MTSEYRPTSRARSYRQHAHDCIEIAVRSADEGTCAALLDLALGWTRMAKQLEKLEPEPGSNVDTFQGVQVLIITPKLEH
jgi:hypothetical protein